MTDKFSHTQGPWLPARMTTKLLNIVKTPTGFRCQIVGNGDGQIVAVAHGKTERECEANARLIAAAPDMLAALKGAELQLRAHKIDCRELSEIRAAIAKAEGK